MYPRIYVQRAGLVEAKKISMQRTGCLCVEEKDSTWSLQLL